MGQILHGCATTTEAIRRAIQHSQESLRAARQALRDQPERPSPNGKRGRTLLIARPARRTAKSTVLSVDDEAVIIAFRKHTLPPLDDCLYSLQPTIPHL